MERPLQVSELTRFIKRILETELPQVEVEGEIGSWKVSARGHAYFNLKDDHALVACVLFSRDLKALHFEPEEGGKVIARGRVSVYEARGQYQLIVNSLEQTGQGDLYRRFLELKEKLEAEGLFDPEKKKPFPAIPWRIGLVTSPTGAAVRDIIQVMGRRFPAAEIVLAPALVQGKEAAGSLVRALDRLRRYHGQAAIDAVIIGRGGGSLEDLWPFNEEKVARAVADFPLPILSAVGHETDFTICDFVADERAPTPSAAAELIVPEQAALLERVQGVRRQLARQLQRMVEQRRLTLQRLKGSWGLRQPLDLVQQAMQRLDQSQNRMERGLNRLRQERADRLGYLQARLNSLNPEAVLERGYSIVQRQKSGRVVTGQEQVKTGEHLKIKLSRGQLQVVTLPPGEDLFAEEALKTE